MKNYLNFETDIKNLESEVEKLKNPYNKDGLSEVDTKKISKSQEKIDSLLEERAEYQLQINSFEVEIGPIKYISAIVYGDKALDYIDTAVRAVILILVFVFDPLAVLLLVSANISFTEYNEKRKRALARKNKVPKNAIKTTVGQPQNGLRKVTKEQNGVSMEYYE